MGNGGNFGDGMYGVGKERNIGKSKSNLKSPNFKHRNDWQMGHNLLWS